MDNGQMPLVQPNQPGVPAGGAITSGGASAGGAQRLYTAEQVEKMMEPKKDIAGLVKTIVIIILSLIAVTFIGLFIWKAVDYNEARADVDGEINEAVAKAKDEQIEEDVISCKKEKENPYLVFAGPVDYGSMNFKYPKTWSVYIADDAADGSDFEAYLNPGQVDSINDNSSIYALRVKIQNRSFEEVAADYQKSLEDKEAPLNVETMTVNNGTTTANRYVGTIPGTEFSGIIVIFKIRDKTAVLQTDSLLFEEYFNALVETVTFNA